MNLSGSTIHLKFLKFEMLRYYDSIAFRKRRPNMTPKLTHQHVCLSRSDCSKTSRYFIDLIALI